MQRKANSSMLKRVTFASVMLGAVCFLIVAARLFKLQVLDYEFYQTKAVTQQTRDKTLFPVRGTIYDTNMKPLAISASTEMVTLEAVKIDDEAQGLEIAQFLSDTLQLDYNEVLAKVEKKASYAVIKRGVEKEDADKIRAFVKEKKLDSIYMVADSTRYYPYGNFLSHVLGFVGRDQQGLAGVEIEYDDVLTGTNGRVITATNAAGDAMPFQYEMYYDAVNGNNVVLTIDEVLQHYLEKNLQMAYNDNKVQVGVSGIVMDVETGGILAMASLPDFNPNDPFTIKDQKVNDTINAIAEEEARAKAKSDALYDMWSNKNISYTYYPGSTFKILTTSMALEEGVVTESSTFTCTGSKIVPGWGKPINCWRYYRPHGAQTLAQAVQNSCNPAFMEIGFAVGAENFTKYVDAFGLREKTGVDLPGEGIGVYNLKSQVDLAVYSFGQNFTVTPLQIITAVSAVANGGTLLEPHVVKEITDEDGNTIKSFGRKEVRQVISHETSDIMRDILESVVTVGTGKNAYTMGYRVAGKTGTTEKIEKQNATGESNLRISSFMAFAPADDPQIAVLILLDEPTVVPVTGGITVAPVIRRFMEEAMPYLNVDPVFTEAELAKRDANVPDVNGMSRADAEKVLRAAGLNISAIGSGEKVTGQVPAVGSIVMSNSKVIVYMGQDVPSTVHKMPDLTGMSTDQAKTTLQNMGIFAHVTGAAEGADSNIRVTKQSTAPGADISYGSVVTIEVSDMNQIAT